MAALRIDPRVAKFQIASPCRGEWQMSEPTSGGGQVLWRKELAYPGRFVKKDRRGHVMFELTVDEPLIDHWVKTHQLMEKHGVDVPVPLGHTQDPEARRGTVERLTKEPSEQPGREGQPALYCYVRFNSPEAAEQLKHSNVSLYQPPFAHCGTGVTFKKPIRHVAITDYPVIPNLGRFKPIAAAFDLALADDADDAEHAHEEEQTMGPYAQLCEEMGISLPEGSGEEEAKAAILQAWEEEEGEHEPVEESAPEGDEHVLQPEAGDVHPGDTEDVEEYEDEEVPPAMGMSFAPPTPTVVKTVANGRRAQLDALKAKITKPMYDKLVKDFCSQDKVTFALSMESFGEEPDGFDSTLVLLSMLPDRVQGEQTGAQCLTPQRQEQVDKDNPVLRAAARRAEAAKAARG